MAIRSIILSASVLVVFAACGRTEAPVHQSGGAVMRNLAVGQVWAYRSRPSDRGSTLTIGKIEELAASGTVVHVSLTGVHVKNPGVPGGYSSELPHAPFTRAAIEGSITDLVGQASPPPQFEAGYQEWRKSQGGVFTISVAEAVDFAEKALNK